MSVAVVALLSVLTGLSVCIVGVLSIIAFHLADLKVLVSQLNNPQERK